MPGAGLDAQVGFAKETTYGTFVAPTRFLPFESESLSLEKNYQEFMGLRGGRYVQPKNLHRATTRSVSGDVVLPFLDQGMGLLFDLLHGADAKPIQIGVTKAYKQIHPLGLTKPTGKSLTCQVGKPGEKVHSFSYLGCKVTALKVTVEESGIAMVTVSLDGSDEVTTEALGAATYDADALPFTFQQMVPKIGGVAVGNMRTISFNIPMPLDTGRYNLGNSGTKDQPYGPNAKMEITGEATLEFETLADHKRYTAEEVVTLDLVGTGAVIEGENNMKATISLTAGKQVNSGPQVGGPGLITTDIEFAAVDDGEKTPATVELISTDIAL